MLKTPKKTMTAKSLFPTFLGPLGPLPLPTCSHVEATVLGLPKASTLGGQVPGTGSGMDCAKAFGSVHNNI